jgi:hypothetical protein
MLSKEKVQSIFLVVSSMLLLFNAGWNDKKNNEIDIYKWNDGTTKPSMK